MSLESKLTKKFGRFFGGGRTGSQNRLQGNLWTLRGFACFYTCFTCFFYPQILMVKDGNNKICCLGLEIFGCKLSSPRVVSRLAGTDSLAFNSYHHLKLFKTHRWSLAVFKALQKTIPPNSNARSLAKVPTTQAQICLKQSWGPVKTPAGREAESVGVQLAAWEQWPAKSLGERLDFEKWCPAKFHRKIQRFGYDEVLILYSPR